MSEIDAEKPIPSPRPSAGLIDQVTGSSDIDFLTKPLDSSLRTLEEDQPSVSVTPLPVPITLAWSNLTMLAAPSTKEDRKMARDLENGNGTPPPRHDARGNKIILDNLSGSVAPGQFMAIIGTSGAGKTSTLNVLADKLSGNISGNVTVNGHARDSKAFVRAASYVSQEDSLLPNLTVWETVSISAKLRLPASLSDEEKMKRTEAVIDDLGLSHVRNSRVGGAMSRGLSGGERRRLSIAVELITDPALLFLDEPTSGLDATTALSISQTLARLAVDGGRTVVATIHQPRSNIFSQFTHLWVLSQGKTVYQGEMRNALPYFKSLGFVPPPHSNLADFFMDITTLDSRHAHAAISQKRVDALSAAYQSSALVKRVDSDLSKPAGTDISKDPHFHGYPVDLFKQFGILMDRTWKNARRNEGLTVVRVATSLIMGLLVGFLYRDLPLDVDSIGDRSGGLFFLMMSTAMPAMMGLLADFPAERRLLIKEVSAGNYRLGAYFLAKQITEAPFMFFGPVITVSVCYNLVGLNPAWDRFWTLILVLSVMSLAAQSYGMFLGSLFKDFQQSQQVSSLFLVILMLTAGLYIDVDSIPWYFSWISWINFMRFGYEGVMSNEWSGQVLSCDANQQLPDGSCFIPDGDAVLAGAGLDEFGVWWSVVILAIITVGFRLLAYFVMSFKVNGKERF